MQTMKKAFSIFCMMAATLVMLVMSGIPHHHHCMGIAGTFHSEYACCTNSHDGSCQQENSPCHEDEGESTCQLHHITLLIERALSLDSNQYSSAYLVEGLLEHDGCQCLEKNEYSKPLSETAISILLTRDKALRAPPVLS